LLGKKGYVVVVVVMKRQIHYKICSSKIFIPQSLSRMFVPR